jgi:hypothetical protein
MSLEGGARKGEPVFESGSGRVYEPGPYKSVMPGSQSGDQAHFCAAEFIELRNSLFPERRKSMMLDRRLACGA